MPPKSNKETFLSVMTHCCRATMIQWFEEVSLMIKPRIIKATNPQTGETIESIRWPNIFIYGLTDEEKEVLEKALPGKEVEITDITGEAVCLVEKVDFAVIINPYNITDDELEFFESFYEDADGCTESIIFTQKKEGVLNKFKAVRTVEYEDLFDMEKNLKYELLQALQKTSKSENYSEKLAMLIKILFAIRNKPYITTKELAEKIEKSDRTVQRYIETLRCAGEFIGYDHQKKGWYLVVDGKSVLLDEF